MTNPATSFFPEGYPESLEIIANIAFERLREQGIDVSEAQVAALDIAERVRKELGGSYLPRGCNFDSRKLRHTVFQEFDGKNHAALARKHRISEVYVRLIIKEGRQNNRNSIN